MKKARWLLYFGYGVLLICYLIFSGSLFTFMINLMAFDTSLSFIWVSILSSIILVVFGLLLGLDVFVPETRKEGNWKVNWPKVIFLVIPLFYFSIGELCPIDFISRGAGYLNLLFLKSGINITPILLIVTGYMIITSFYKYNPC